MLNKFKGVRRDCAAMAMQQVGGDHSRFGMGRNEIVNAGGEGVSDPKIHPHPL